MPWETPGAGGRCLGNTSAKVYYYHTDQIGSNRKITDQQGQKVWNADYAAFGKQEYLTGSIEELHSFTGKELDPDTGLHYYNARWYDAETGRFISEDPAADPNNPNLYSYCANDPVNGIDPSGLDWYTPGTTYNDNGQTTNTATGKTTDWTGSGSSSSSSSSSSGSSSNNNNSSWINKINDSFNKWLSNPNQWWNKSTGYDLDDLMAKRERGAYYEQYQKQNSSYFGSTVLYGVDALYQYSLLTASGKIDSSKYTFENYVNNMGPVWEAQYKSRTPASEASALMDVACAVYMVTEGASFVKSLNSYLSTQEIGLEAQEVRTSNRLGKLNIQFYGSEGPFSAKGVLKDAKLPTVGKVRYVPPEKWTPTQPLPKQSGGFVDKYGNLWTKGPSRTEGQAFEWDVQLSKTGKSQLGWASRDGAHLNVSLDGRITHQ